MARREAIEVDLWLRKWEELDSSRAVWKSHWQEIAQRIWPEADDFYRGRTPGSKRTEQVFDSKGWRALDQFAPAMESLLIPRSSIWHLLAAADKELNKDPSVKGWFEIVNQLLFDYRQSPRAAFYSNMHEGFLSLGAFGNMCLFVDEAAGGGVRYRYCHINQIAIATDLHGQVDTILRKYPLSAHAAMQKWGKLWGTDVPQAVQKLLDGNKPWECLDFLHIVTPREHVDPDALGPEGKPWQSIHIAMADRKLIDEGGYHELPYLYSRWSVNPWEVYGRSPAMKVLPEIKFRNEAKKVLMRSWHRELDPPILLHDDGPIGAGSIAPNLLPGGLNMGTLDSQGRELMKPFRTGGRVDLGPDLMEAEGEAIDDAFLAKVFRILAASDDPAKTATEVLEIVQEKGQLIAPQVGRQQSELFGPEIQRLIAILFRQGLLPPMPPALLEAGGQYKIEYRSPATQYQRASELLGIQRTIEMLEPFVAAGHPEVLDVFKPEEIARLSADIQGVPAQVLRTPEEYEELLQAHQQAMAEQQQGAAAALGAKALKDGAGAIAQLRPGQTAAA